MSSAHGLLHGCHYKESLDLVIILTLYPRILSGCHKVEALRPGGLVQEVAKAAHMDRVDLSAHGFYKTPDITGFGGNRPFSYFTYGAVASEVELDTLTGDFQVRLTL